MFSYPTSHNHQRHLLFVYLYFSWSTQNLFCTSHLKKSNLDKYYIGNYCPISDLSFLTNLTERVVRLRLFDYLSMSSNSLSLYPSKTNYLVFGLPQQLSKLDNPTIHLPNNIIISPVHSAHSLGSDARKTFVTRPKSRFYFLMSKTTIEILLAQDEDQISKTKTSERKSRPWQSSKTKPTVLHDWTHAPQEQVCMVHNKHVKWPLPLTWSHALAAVFVMQESVVLRMSLQ